MCESPGEGVPARSGGMFMETDNEFFRRRASDEESAARNATHAEAGNAHLEMARRYRDLAGPPPLTKSGPSEQIIAQAG